MRFDPLEVSETHIVYACLGGFVVLFSLSARLAKEKLFVGEVVFATLFGIILGPSGANVFRPRDWGSISENVTNQITLEVTRIVLALGVFAVGVELPKSYLAQHWKSLTYLVVPVMFFGWISSAGLLVAIFPKITYLSALVVSACLTPTDPILAAAIVGGHYADQNVPTHVRRLLAAESASNDGLAYPFLFFSLYLSLDKTTGEAVKEFVTTAVLYSVVLGVLVGIILGLILSRLMRLMQRRGFIGSESYVVQFVALVLFIEGVVTLMGSDDLLACFAAGMLTSPPNIYISNVKYQGSAISWDGYFNEQVKDDEVFAALVDTIMNCVVFVFIGAWIQFPDWTNPSVNITPVRLVAFFCSILLTRRIPAVMLLYPIVPDIHNWREALFCGWFGPMGVGGIFISTLALTYLPEAQKDNPQGQLQILATCIQPIVSSTILGSILVHGLSIPAFSLVRNVTLSRSTTMNTQTEWIGEMQHIERGAVTPRSETIAATPSRANSPEARNLPSRTVTVMQDDGFKGETSSTSLSHTRNVDGGPNPVAEKRSVAFVQTDDLAAST
ncbi:hypothetical protein DL93DRAFT_1767443 [Clavulina sp. PMI_390]|nr:hypothetical protein DL93DRAFT_1767443 [Clavulina sp. PMI_390]